MFNYCIVESLVLKNTFIRISFSQKDCLKTAKHLFTQTLTNHKTAHVSRKFKTRKSRAF